MRLCCERIALYDAIQLLEAAVVEGNESLGLQHALVLLDLIAGGEAPKKTRQTVDAAVLLQDIADAGYLLLREPVGGAGDYSRSELISVHDVSSKRQTSHIGEKRTFLAIGLRAELSECDVPLQPSFYTARLEVSMTGFKRRG